MTDQAFQEAVRILIANRALLDETAKDLLAKETLSAEDLAVIATRLAPEVALTRIAGRIARVDA